MVHKDDKAERDRLMQDAMEDIQPAICQRLRSTVFAEPAEGQRLRGVAEEAACTIEQLCSALELLLSADPDMPTYQDDYDAAEEILEKVRG